MIFASRIAAVTLAVSWTCASTPFAETGHPPQPPTDEATPRIEAESDLVALDRAKDAFKLGAWEDAVPFLEKMVEGDPASPEARGLLTKGYARSGLASDAASSLKTFPGLVPSPDEAERVGEAIQASFGDGTRAPSRPGVEPPAALRIPSPRHPRGQDASVQTTVRVLTRVREDGAVVDTVLVPNRIWREIRDEGFEAAAIDAVEHGKFAAGTNDGQRAALWLVVAVTFAGA